jgi:hypothetical protein
MFALTMKLVLSPEDPRILRSMLRSTTLPLAWFAALASSWPSPTAIPTRRSAPRMV